MIDAKAKIYSAMAADAALNSAVGGRFRYHADDVAEDSPLDSRLPEITYSRIHSTPSPNTGVRNELFQISAWAKDPVTAESVSQKAVALFNRRKDADFRYVSVVRVDDSFDAESKAYGVHLTVRFTVFDPTY